MLIEKISVGTDPFIRQCGCIYLRCFRVLCRCQIRAVRHDRGIHVYSGCLRYRCMSSLPGIVRDSRWRGRCPVISWWTCLPSFNLLGYLYSFHKTRTSINNKSVHTSTRSVPSYHNSKPTLMRNIRASYTYVGFRNGWVRGPDTSPLWQKR